MMRQSNPELILPGVASAVGSAGARSPPRMWSSLANQWREMLGRAVSNFAHRFTDGSVTPCSTLRWGGPLPTFNLADGPVLTGTLGKQSTEPYA
jgi:hypothetical protein